MTTSRATAFCQAGSLTIALNPKTLPFGDSLRDPIDSSRPKGMFSLQVLGAVAQPELALIAERTKAGIEAARATASVPGDPGPHHKR
nr:recombinase family protein [Rhizobium leguminosarum]